MLTQFSKWPKRSLNNIYDKLINDVNNRGWCNEKFEGEHFSAKIP